MKLVRKKAPGELWRQWDPKTDDPMDADVETMDVEPVALANRIVELESELESARLAYRQDLTMRQRTSFCWMWPPAMKEHERGDG
jgi:hypothetical protein